MATTYTAATAAVRSRLEYRSRMASTGLTASSTRDARPAHTVTSAGPIMAPPRAADRTEAL